ncbi:MAG: LPS-assembly protein LptD [Betaproteobacteria bacterium]|nr:LPS-assembly protein LptD [Betaproteobacteria bacterium]
MIFRPAIIRWYPLLPVILVVLALPITAGAQINPISRHPDEDDRIISATPQQHPLSGRLDRGLNLEYQTEAQKKPSRKPDTYTLLRNERQMDTVLATGRRRYGNQQKVQTFDFYSHTKKRPPKQKTILEDDQNAPIIFWAEQITGRPDRELNLDSLVEMEKGQTRITGDHGIFRQVENEVEFIGNVDIMRYGDRYKSESIQLNLDTGEGVLNRAKYWLSTTGGQGKAERIDLEDKYNTTIVNGTYTTCEGENPDWYLATNALNLDTARNIGTAGRSVLYFKNVPILGAPFITFPLSNERKSGFLPPTLGVTSKGGMELAVPYYFNLAPNYDLTIFPKYIAKRGFQMGALGRYLGHTYSGKTYIEYLPNDNAAHRDRYVISSQHKHNFAPGWAYTWDFSKASDNNYPDDFSSPVFKGNRILLQDGNVSYSDTYWNLMAGASRYQILQDKAAPIVPSYDRLPYVNLNAFRYDMKGFDMTTNLQYARFWLSDDKLQNRQRGDRYVAKPSVSFPMVSSGYFLTPRASVHYASYNLDSINLQHGQDRNMSRTIPTLSLDSGLIFERPTSFFRTDMTQTLEPRLFYVYTPYRNQSKYPIFDSGEPGFGYAQLFAENRFVGEDRIADANNLTAAVTSRYIEQSGAERMRFTIGQRYYFSNQRVTLFSPGNQQDERRSDLLLLANGLLTPKLAVDAAIQYNQQTSRTYSANYSLQWRPADKKVLNAEYRYLRNSVDEFGNVIDQINVSGQWPLGKRWYAVGQISYSLPDSKTIESLFGVEYNADCWIGRIVAQRRVTSSTESNTALFFQLELKGMSKIGSNPLESLRKSIPGYRPLTSYEK